LSTKGTCVESCAERWAWMAAWHRACSEALHASSRRSRKEKHAEEPQVGRTQIRGEGGGEGRAGAARDEARPAQVRAVGQEGQQPRAGDCDRAQRSAARRGQGPAPPVDAQGLAAMSDRKVS